MWQSLSEQLPPLSVWVAAALSFVLPLFFSWLMQILHKQADPPWLQKERHQQQQKKQTTRPSQQQKQKTARSN
ncbi:hypothetical protein [Effusibacillus dendaii]|uniref:Uncharacterized protein n=1 Tax=Effusibacillus dendaii TaxID=2743772 RepID=A0A7I8D9S6_9BACL|nr:hypothetical protein [Effusibacillus dendaii]BCJ86835.1 hypothetical protein skT53_18200 [Effusibacillus dendaii]